MPIPDLNSEGFLPDRIHDCTIEEAKSRFGRFQDSDRRPLLWGKFMAFFQKAKSCVAIEAVLLARIFHRQIEQRSGESVRRLEITQPNENATHRFF